MHLGPLYGEWPFGGLGYHCYDMIMADPPWLYNLFSIKGEGKSAQSKYRCLPLEEIKAFPVMDLAAPNCLLLMWATNPMIRLQMEVIDAWGFEYKTMMTWNKITANKERRVQCFGTGYIVRSSSEPILIATRGKPKTTKSVRSSFDGIARRHSEKPEEAFAMAEKLMPKARRVELFSRTDRPGWDAWGDQVGVMNDKDYQAAVLRESLANPQIMMEF